MECLSEVRRGEGAGQSGGAKVVVVPAVPLAVGENQVRAARVDVLVLLLPQLRKLLVPHTAVGLEDGKGPNICSFLPCLLIKVDVPGHDEVRVEAGEGVPGRTDGHVGEVQVRDGESLYGGGDRTVSPAREGLLDQHSGSSEASDDDEEPENSDRMSGSGDVDQAVNGRRF